MENSVKKSFVDRIKSVRMPVFQLIFYSSLGYLGYCFYQDYRYQQLLKEINSRSNKQNTLNPLKKVTQIVHKIQHTQSKRQLKSQLKDLQSATEKYWIDPKKSYNLIDFEMKQIPKSEQEKKIWWMTPYTTSAKLYLSIYHRCDIIKDGIFGIFFWSNLKVEEKNDILESNSIKQLLRKAIRLRRTKCEQFGIKNIAGGVLNMDREIYECLSDTTKEVSSLQKMADRLQMIYRSQYK